MINIDDQKGVKKILKEMEDHISNVTQMNIYSIYDKVAGECGPLFEAANDGVAIRKFRQVMESASIEEKGDYQLLMVGYVSRKRGGQIELVPSLEIKIMDSPLIFDKEIKNNKV